MLDRVIKSNPSFLSEIALKENFVVRHADLDLIVEVIRENTTGSNQHVLVIGPRGSGKTTLVLRTALEVRTDSELGERWYPMVFAEESYQVVSAGEFWLEALFHLAEQTGDQRWKKTWEELRDETDDNRLADRALYQLLDFADRQGKRILLIVENLNMLLSDLINDEEAWKIRHTLMNEPRFMLLASATNRFEHFENSSQAMFEMFKMHQLTPLDDDECNAIWELIAGKKLDGEKIRPIRILTGGNPRLLAIIAKFGAGRSFGKLLDDLVDLIDDHTEYFKSHLDNLPATERKAYLALAELWDLSTAREVAKAARLDVNGASSLLNRLAGRGAVTVEKRGKRIKYYAVAERMYNIYYLMRRRGRPADRVKAAVKFMIGMYGPESATKLIAEEACKLGPNLCRDHYLAYAEVVKEVRDPRVLEKIISSTEKSFLESPYIDDSIKNLFVSGNRSEARGNMSDAANVAQEASNLIDQGAKLFRDGDYAQALTIFDGVIMKFGESDGPDLVEWVAKALIYKGLALGALGRFEDAIRAYEEVVARFGGSGEPGLAEQVAKALFSKGVALGALDRSEDEIRAYEEVVERFGDSGEPGLAEPVAKALFNKGVTLGALGRSEDEIRAYEEVVERFGDSNEPGLAEQVGKALFNKGVAFRALGRPEDAMRAYEEVVERFGDSNEPGLAEQVGKALVNKGWSLNALGRSEDAIGAYEEVVDRFGDSNEPGLAAPVGKALVNKGVALGALCRSEDAIRAYEEVVARFGDSGEPVLAEQVASALYNKGVALGALGRSEDAIGAYEEVEDRFGDSNEPGLAAPVGKALVNKGVTLGALGRPEDAIRASEEVVARFGDSGEPVLAEQVASALYNKGVALRALGRSEDAIRACEEVVDRFGDSGEPSLAALVAKALYNKGWNLGALGRSEDAIRAYEEVVERFGNSGEPVLAEQVANALLNKGVALGALGRPEDAIRACEEVVERFGDSGEPGLAAPVAKALYNKGWNLGALGRSEDAIRACEEVVERFGGSGEPVLAEQVAKALAYKGVTLRALGRYDEAEEALHKATRMDSESAYAHIELIELLLQSPERREDALRLAEEIIKRKPDDAELLNEISRAFYEENIPSLLQKAETWARRAVSISPGDLANHHTLASLLSALGKGKEALEFAEKCVSNASFVESTIEDEISLIVDLAASGYAKESLELIENSPAAVHLEPLIVGLKLYCGEDVKTAVEILEVARDVVRRIEDRKQERKNQAQS
jgi:tetratricopeptide (TPR) repeat protein/energy-coupling factor transporter ATP-binding protein EcfA2